MSNIVKVGAKVSKTAKRADRKNKSNLRVAVEDDDAVFGRVTKVLGNRRFLVTYWDPENRRHVVDIQATIAKKKVRIDINDIVNIAGSGREWEIQAQIDPKSANKLKKEGRISAELLLATENAPVKAAGGGDALEFDYGEDEEGEESDSDGEEAKPKKGEALKGKKVVDAELEDADIDAI
jgi:translation initiation factor IF-1